MRPLEYWRAVHGVEWTGFTDSDEWVVWCARSGEVHLVTAAVHHLWSLMSNEPLQINEMLTALATERRQTADDELTAATLETLAFMDEAGIVELVSR